jgi:hypothetical protein
MNNVFLNSNLTCLLIAFCRAFALVVLLLRKSQKQDEVMVRQDPVVLYILRRYSTRLEPLRRNSIC